MRSTYKITTLGAAMAAVLLLGACSNEAATGTTGQTNPPATGQSTAETETETTTTDPTASTGTTDSSATTENEAATEANGSTTGMGTDAESTSSASATRPEKETFELMTEGTLEKRTAKLQQGEGYSMYVFDAYTLDKQKSRLQLTAFPQYHVEITKLDSKANIDELRKQGKEALKKYGSAKEYSGDQLYEDPLVGAKLYLQVSSDKGTYDYVVWEAKDGSQYTFLMIMPQGEASETFRLPAVTSLSTIAADSAS
ncbi:hypothetical protein L2089_08260 [Paenibacillus hunanensis]|uniref:hypothetical protein n=1 Tax=Paenibacillus hunanensis TaxID=539262 RepID=UPI002026FB89|nr:hypothetical protein [Paenibacillus hunanensis]MCL9660672.1 hypothetical protein [Paenibacillus hunanensis]